MVFAIWQFNSLRKMSHLEMNCLWKRMLFPIASYSYVKSSETTMAWLDPFWNLWTRSWIDLFWHNFRIYYSWSIIKTGKWVVGWCVHTFMLLDFLFFLWYFGIFRDILGHWLSFWDETNDKPRNSRPSMPRSCKVRRRRRKVRFVTLVEASPKLFSFRTYQTFFGILVISTRQIWDREIEWLACHFSKIVPGKCWQFFEQMVRIWNQTQKRVLLQCLHQAKPLIVECHKVATHHCLLQIWWTLFQF